MQIGRGRIESRLDPQRALLLDRAGELRLQFALLDDVHRSAEDQLHLTREFAHSFAFPEGGRTDAFTVINGRSRSNFFSPIPFTSSNSSIAVNDPFDVLASTTRFAKTSPIPGSRCKSSALARLRSSRDFGFATGEPA